VAKDPFDSMPTIKLARAWQLLHSLSLEEVIPVGSVVPMIDAVTSDSHGTKTLLAYWQQEPARTWLTAESSTVGEALNVLDAVTTQLGVHVPDIYQSRIEISVPRVSKEARQSLDGPLDWLLTDSARIGKAVHTLFLNRASIHLEKAKQANDGRPTSSQQLAARLNSYPARIWRDGLSFQKLYLVAKALQCSPSELIPSLEELEAKSLRLMASDIEDSGAIAFLRYTACTPVRNHDGYLHSGSVASVLARDGATFNSLSACGSAIIRTAECVNQARPSPAS